MNRSKTFSVSIASIASALVLAFAAGSALASEPVAVGAPSPVPHPVKDYLPITIDKNMCMACHAEQKGDVRRKGETPRSHFMAPGQLAGERFECMLCHAESSGAPLPAPVDPNDSTR